MKLLTFQRVWGFFFTKNALYKFTVIIIIIIITFPSVCVWDRWSLSFVQCALNSRPDAVTRGRWSDLHEHSWMDESTHYVNVTRVKKVRNVTAEMTEVAKIKLNIFILSKCEWYTHTRFKQPLQISVLWWQEGHPQLIHSIYSHWHWIYRDNWVLCPTFFQRTKANIWVCPVTFKTV